MTIDLKIKSKVFNKCYIPYLNDETPTQIYYGGSASGKSVFVAQRCIMDMASGGHNYLCVRNVQKTIHNSMFNEICKTITRFGLIKYFKINKSDMKITCDNGFQILFVGLDDVEKVKSITPIKGVLTDIWIEEATEVLQNDVRQLQRRLRGKSKVHKRLMMSFNPILKSHWIFTEYFGKWDDEKTSYTDDKVSIMKTTYKDNLRFLDDGDIALLEDETDEYYHEVYTLGNWGVLGNVIFKNWSMQDLTEVRKTFETFRNGMDFGFAEPAAIVRGHYDKNIKTLYILDEVYERELSNEDLYTEGTKLFGKEYVVCDSAEPKSISKLRTLGMNALKAKKGKDSVNFGVEWLRGLNIVIDTKCQNAKNEFQQYKYREDKDGNVLRDPVDKFNHLIDALRYAYEDEMENRRMTAAKSFM